SPLGPCGFKQYCSVLSYLGTAAWEASHPSNRRNCLAHDQRSSPLCTGTLCHWIGSLLAESPQLEQRSTTCTPNRSARSPNSGSSRNQLVIQTSQRCVALLHRESLAAPPHPHHCKAPPHGPAAPPSALPDQSGAETLRERPEVAPGSLQGDGLRQKTLIQLWLRFAEREIVPLLYICVYPLLGILPVLAQPMERAMGAFKKVMSVLETQLRTRTYMVGERLSLADITLVSALVMPYLLVFDPTFRQPYGSVSRWFMMCVNIPAFAEVLGHVTLCEEPMRYGEGNVVSITFPIRRPEEAAEDAEVEVEEAAEVEVEAAEVEVVEEQAAAGEEPAHGNNSDHEE
uniref:GST C-terminal domain-containing protein n=1 Tax=Leptobrachium leishanense TaxID=445787 RepID=A0A8C5WMR6_9ANUR